MASLWVGPKFLVAHIVHFSGKGCKMSIEEKWMRRHDTLKKVKFIGKKCMREEVKKIKMLQN